MQKRQVYISSDWHLGGTFDSNQGGSVACGTSIFRATGELVAFIDYVRAASAKFQGVTEFVINGDMVDFLAPDPQRNYWPASWQNNDEIVIRRLNEIAEDMRTSNDGRGPFDALRDLVGCGVELTILLGNHDVELSLPLVRRELERLVGASHGSFRFLFDGEAYSRDGLIIEHGNRYDHFNCLDYNHLRQERSLLSRGFKTEATQRGIRYFAPPMGSEIVVNEINPRLANGAFINLLKPEVPAVVPLLLALFPETVKSMDLCFRIYGGLRSFMLGGLDEQSQPLELGRLTSKGTSPPESLEAFLQEELGRDNAKAFPVRSAGIGQLSGSPLSWASIGEAAKKCRVAVDLVDLVSNWIEVFKSRTDEQRMNQVRCALRKVNEGHTFSQTTEKKRYLEAAKSLVNDTGNQVAVFGHTHFPKEISLGEGKMYLNAGAWADVARLPMGIFSSDPSEVDKSITKFLADMKENRIHPYLLQNRTFVRAVIENGRVSAELKSFSTDKMHE